MNRNLQTRINELKALQTKNGSWAFNFEGPVLTDSFTIIVLKTLQIPARDIFSQLVERLVALQQQNGSWKLHSDETDGNLSATIQVYTALLLSGQYVREDSIMQRAEAFIERKGGVKKAHFMTKMLLAVNGLYAYPPYFYFPMTYFLLPTSFPLSMYHCSNYARVHLTPMIICLNKKFVVNHQVDAGFLKKETGGWFREDRDGWGEYFIEQLKAVALTPLHVHKAGYRAAERLMLERIEKNGTLYSYASATFYMIYALLALGYKTDSAVIQKAVKGILSYVTKTRNGLHVQNSPSTVWDTALLSYALQEAGMSENDPTIVKANTYLLKKQQVVRGDWSVNAPKASAGGWGFSDSNHFIPDHDDTSAALRALTQASHSDHNVKAAWKRGTAYLLSMQNKDGGWGAFEKNAYQPILAHLPIENAKDAIIDNSTADLTGRVLEFLGNFGKMNIYARSVKKATDWLLREQEANGSWYGKWGVCYIYGTWAAITGLRATGTARDHPAIVKAIQWLETIQNDDGGWGESCVSAELETYVPLTFSTPSQTAWAIDALLTVRNPKSSSVQKGIHYLLNQAIINDEAKYYPTGMGLPGGFYIYYESYNQLYPLLALGHYRKKILG
ncbi:MAG: squalene--hopene cyclase [Bacillus sp. (in: firmicutes)]